MKVTERLIELHHEAIKKHAEYIALQEKAAEDTQDNNSGAVDGDLHVAMLKARNEFMKADNMFYEFINNGKGQLDSLTIWS
jgi:hypothetical protein